MKNLLFAMLLLMVVPVARAGLWVEPYLGYLSGNADMTFVSTTVEYSYKTPMLGARLGYGMMGVSAGVDYSMSIGTFELEQDTPATSATPDKNKYSNLGIYVNYKFPVMFRIWGTYFLKNKMTTDEPASSKDDTISGKGFALGAGFTGLPFVAINLEYRMITFDELKDNSSGVTTTLPTAGSTELESKELMLSVSVPFDL